MTPEPEKKDEPPVVPFSWQVIPEIPQVEIKALVNEVLGKKGIGSKTKYFNNQAEQTPELEDKYKPTLLETPEPTAPWRRAKSPQVYTQSSINIHRLDYTHTHPYKRTDFAFSDWPFELEIRWRIFVTTKIFH